MNSFTLLFGSQSPNKKWHKQSMKHLYLLTNYAVANYSVLCTSNEYKNILKSQQMSVDGKWE